VKVSILLLSLLGAIAAQIAAAGESGACDAATGAAGTPLVELYTSEGCSSCPPADRWFSEFAASDSGRTAVPLAFHVDYWNELGWKDRFSDPRFTARQQRRVERGGGLGAGIFTPQVMVGRQTEFNWTHAERMPEALAKSRSPPAAAQIELGAQVAAGAIDASVRAEIAPSARQHDPVLYLALYSDGLQSMVARGENAGAVLNHDRVVRALYGPWHADPQGRIVARQKVVIPSERGKKLGLAAFVEEAGGGAALQAVDLRLDQCG
jgi:hypothetical protein